MTRWLEAPLEQVLLPRQLKLGPADESLTDIPVVAKVRFADGGIELRSDVGSRTQMILAYPDDVLLSGINAIKGAVALVPDGGPLAASIHYSTYQVRSQVALPAFVWWFLRSPTGRRRMAESVPGGIKSEVRPASLLQIRMPLPPLDEQQRILRGLTGLEQRIKDVRKLSGMLGSNGQGIVGSLLDGLFGDPYSGRPGRLDPSTFVPLEELVDDVADGPHKTPMYTEDGVPFITALNVAAGTLTFAPVKSISIDDHRTFQVRARAERGDVLITKDGTIGSACTVDTDREFSFFVSVALVKPNRKSLDGRFLVWLLRSPSTQQRMQLRARGDMIKHLVLREIRGLLCPKLSLETQAQVVRDVERVAALERQVRALRLQVDRELEVLMPRALDAVFGDACRRRAA